MVRKAIVLCAGEGRRLRPLTFTRPKHLLPVAGEPILSWALRALAEVGVEQVAAVVGYQGDAVVEYLGDGSRWGLEMECIWQPQPKGIGHAVALTQDFVGDDPFIAYLGDNLFEQGIGGFAESLKDDDWDAGIMVRKVDDPRAFGVAEVEGGRVLRVVEKPREPQSELAVVGVYAFRPSVFDALSRIPPSARGEVEITDAIQRLVDDGVRVRYSEVGGLWEDAGEPSSLLRANREWLDLLPAPADASLPGCEISGPVWVAPGATVRGSRLIGPCIIAAGAEVSGTKLGPHVAIGEDCYVSDSDLVDCILLRGSRVQGMGGGLSHSLLGEGAAIVADDPTASATDAVLGDVSRIHLGAAS